MPLEKPERAETAPPPIDLSTLSRPSRSLFKRLTSYPSWHAEGWAHPSDEHLRADAEYKDKRPIQRARRALVALGLVEHREVRRGELLPNGERARFRHWIYVAGPVARPPSNDGGGESMPAVPEERCEKGTDAVPDGPPIGAISAPRSVDPERSEKDRSSAPPEPPPAPPPVAAVEDRTSLCSKGSTEETPAPTPTARSPEIATSVLACEVARYFVQATGLGWRTIREDVVDFLTPFLDGMNGDATSKVHRACRVIDAAVLETPKPTLRYVFHPEIFWKRLGALANPTAKPLARAGKRADATLSADPSPRRAPTEPRPLTVTPPASAVLEPIEPPKPPTDRPWSRANVPEPAPAEPSPMTPEELAELEELYRVDNAARARRGLPPRFPSQRAA